MGKKRPPKLIKDCITYGNVVNILCGRFRPLGGRFLDLSQGHLPEKRSSGNTQHFGGQGSVASRLL